MREKVEKEHALVKTSNAKPSVTLRRVGASQFALTGAIDHNETNEGHTIFTMCLKQTQRDSKWENFRRRGLNDRAMKVYFRGEGSIDDGGPLRETYDFMCMELQTSVLPVLVPTVNNQT